MLRASAEKRAFSTHWLGRLIGAVALCTLASRSLSQSVDAFNPGISGTSTAVNALAVQGDGRIVIGGVFTNFPNGTEVDCARLNPDGSLDSGFNTFLNGKVNCLQIQEDDKIVLAGAFSILRFASVHAIGRMSTNGFSDTYNSPGLSGPFLPTSPQIYALALQSDGKMLVGGSYTTTFFNGTSRTNLMRLNTNGTPDTTFAGVLIWPDEGVYALALQPDGKVLVGGGFLAAGTPPGTNLVRLNTNGTLDTTFHCLPWGLARGKLGVCSLAVQPDGKILVGGAFTNISGQPRSCLARLNTDGTLDPGFSAEADGGVLTLATQADGRILVAGFFTNLAGQACQHLGRLNPDGSFDAQFNAGANSNVTALALQADGRILAGGMFTNLAGQPRSRIGRLLNTDPAAGNLSFDGTNILWVRGGTAPEVWRTIFSASTNGSNWQNLGPGVRAPNGWQLGGLALPPSATIRARGFVVGSGGYVESDFGPPAIVSVPSFLRPSAGQTIQLTVVAVGSPNLGYQWYRNGAAISDGGDLTGTQTPTLIASNVLGADNGNYTLIISNSSGSVTSRPISLIVSDPWITNEPASLTVRSRQPASFAVSVRGSVPFFYQWRNHGTNMPGATASSYAVANPQAIDAGSAFDVIISNSFGAATSTVAGLSVDLASLDSFNANPEYGLVYGLAVQPDLKVLAGGNFLNIGGFSRPSLALLNPDGTVNSNFYPPITFGSALRSVLFQPDLEIVFGGAITWSGSSQSGVGWLAGTGIVESAFAPMAGGCPSVQCLVRQPDGWILVGGSFTNLAGQPCTNLGRLNPNGTIDPVFNAGKGSDCPLATCLALQPDGRIVVGGLVGSISGSIGRLNPDGSRDPSFSIPGTVTITSPSAIVVQPDGKILVAAEFQIFTTNGTQTDWLKRLNQDGTLDTGFSPQIGASASGGGFAVNTLALQTDGRIIVGGQMSTLRGQPRQYIGRLEADGSLDYTFAPNIDGQVFGLGLQPDGGVLIAGQFQTVDGQPRTCLARLRNTTPASQQLSFDARAITWQRNGSSPEIWTPSFESSLDGTNWTQLGTGARVPGGWRLDGLSLPRNSIIRARGFQTGGWNNGSSWFVESTLALGSNLPPLLTVTSGIPGAGTNGFGLQLSALVGQTVVLEASTDLRNWTPLTTNLVTASPAILNDPTSPTLPWRFYRARLR